MDAPDKAVEHKLLQDLLSHDALNPTKNLSKSPDTTEGFDRFTEFAKLYYETQYTRMGKIEDQRLSITNVIITLSVLVFTFGLQNQQTTNLFNTKILLATIASINLFAIYYIILSLRYIETHRRRAAKLMELFAESVHNVDSVVPWPKPRLKMGLLRMQSLIHLLIIALAVISILLIRL